MIPNFFIVGAPRSGTTALSEYLGQHPDVFFSHPKEPRYWCKDLTVNEKVVRRTPIGSLEEYMELFDVPGRNYTAVGEGSTLYLVSRVAIKEINTFNPDARVIIALRNPVDLFHSWHTFLIRQFQEEVRDPVRAWNLQRSRSKGLEIPDLCDVPAKLQYLEMVSLGNQVKRVLDIVPRDQLHFVLYDDFVENPGLEYRKILDFLGLPDDGRSEFPPVNNAFTYSNRWVAKLMLVPGPKVLNLISWIKKKDTTGLLGRLRYRTILALRKNTSKQKLPKELVDQIKADTRDDVELLARLINRNLESWM